MANASHADEASAGSVQEGSKECSLRRVANAAPRKRKRSAEDWLVDSDSQDSMSGEGAGLHISESEDEEAKVMLGDTWGTLKCTSAACANTAGRATSGAHDLPSSSSAQQNTAHSAVAAVLAPSMSAHTPPHTCSTPYIARGFAASLTVPFNLHPSILHCAGRHRRPGGRHRVQQRERC